MIAVLLNPTAGGSKTSDLPGKLEASFAAAGAAARVVVLDSPASTAGAVRRALDSGATVVAAGGGDGTVSTVAGALLDTGVPLGVPVDLEQAVTVIASGRRVVVRVSTDEATETFRTPFLFVANNEYQVDGISLGRRTRLDQARLYAYVAPRQHARHLPKLAVSAILGRATRHPSLRAVATSELDVDTPGRRMLRVALDGEVIYMPTPLRFRVRHGALDVMATPLTSASI